MENNKRYRGYRLRALKRLSQNYDRERSRRQGNEEWIFGGMPIIEGHHKFDPWVIWLRDKIDFGAM